ncbi:MAG: FtsW/RodA/SpoVE family cell cycle protein [Actinomycetes bacterium]
MLFVCLGVLGLVPVVGVSVLGNKNWLPLPGGMNLQPSELAKLALIVWSADLLARKHKLLHDWKHLLVPVGPVALVILGLILAGHDLGTALIVIAIVASILYVVGAPLRIFLAGAGVAALGVAFLVATSSNRVSRIGAWLNPSADQAGSNFQLTHGKYALATGGWWGLGLGASKQKWGGLPEAHTDFIYAIIGEELGLLGTVSVLLLFAAITIGGYRVAARSSDLFVRLAAAGVTMWITAQVIVNIGAVLGLLPIVGVPLPLVSYGGSALIPMLAGLGMLASFARSEPEAALALRSRPPLLRRLFPQRGTL